MGVGEGAKPKLGKLILKGNSKSGTIGKGIRTNKEGKGIL